MNLTIGQILQKGIIAHKKGKLEDAERLYRAILQSHPSHPDANHNLGVLAVSVNKAGEALPYFKAALEANSQVEQFWLSYVDALIKEQEYAAAKQALAEGKMLGFTGEKFNIFEAQLMQLSVGGAPSQEQIDSLLEHYQAGRYRVAEQLAVTMTLEFSGDPFGWKILGAVFAQTGRKSEAVNAFEKVVALSPQDAEAYNNLGIALNEQGDFDKAIKYLKNAISRKTDYIEAHINLGNILQENGQYNEAIKSFHNALSWQPENVKAYNNIGVAFRSLDKTDEAIKSFHQALKLAPTNNDIYFNMALALKGITFSRPVPGMSEILCYILEKKNLSRPKDIAIAAVSLIKIELPITNIIKNNLPIKHPTEIITLINILSGSPLLLTLMKFSPIPDIDIEKLLRNIRRAILLNLSQIKNSPELLPFQITLSMQCFINEYLYLTDETEEQCLQQLQDSLRIRYENGSPTNANEQACLASYKPLSQFQWLSSRNIPTEIESIYKSQIIEPKKEKCLLESLPRLQNIEDTISSKVQNQYEQYPYPRWINLNLHLPPQSISYIEKSNNIRINDPIIFDVNNPKVLIAGCGTGQHSIETAAKFKDCDVLAIDLSLNSLAYAKRKTEEFGIKNIKYMQADILDIAKVNETFDIIESIGVLHHMDNPLAGWKALVGCLKRGGLMMVGLYSDLARQHIVKIHNEIEQEEFILNDKFIRSVRTNIIKSKMEHHERVRSSPDFYNISSIRDLLFPEIEHRFTIPIIKQYLNKLGLTFCGFQHPKLISFINNSNKLSAENIYYLDTWEEFEKDNPRTFIGMYQFWCQKL